MIKKVITSILFSIISLNANNNLNNNDIKIEIQEQEKKMDKIKKGITFSFGEGNTELYIVISMNEKSKKLFEKLEQEKDKVKVNVLLKPNDNSYDIDTTKKTSWILMGKNEKEKEERTKKILLKNSTLYKWIMAYKNLTAGKELKEINEKMKNTQEAIKELGVTEYPSVYDRKLKQIK